MSDSTQKMETTIKTLQAKLDKVQVDSDDQKVKFSTMLYSLSSTILARNVERGSRLGSHKERFEYEAGKSYPKTISVRRRS